jgi:hypothetical protein
MGNDAIGHEQDAVRDLVTPLGRTHGGLLAALLLSVRITHDGIFIISGNQQSAWCALRASPTKPLGQR